MTNPLLIEIYSKPQEGGELPYFVGRQVGGGWLRTLGRIAFPIIKRLAGVAANTAQDVIMHDKKLLPSLTQNALDEVQRSMPGSSSRPKKRSINKKRGIKLNDTVLHSSKKRRHVL